MQTHTHADEYVTRSEWDAMASVMERIAATLVRIESRL